MNDAIDITASQRKTILSLLERYLPDAEVWVYGSRANWTSRPASDLDMVVFTTPEQSGKVADLKEAFEESNLPFRVDLFVWDDIPDSFKRNIEAEHVVLREAVKDEQSRMRSGWTRTTLGEIAQLKNGKGLKNRFYCEDGAYPVWGANGAIARTNELLNDESVVVIGRVGAYCGSVHAAFGPNWVTDNAIIATPQVDNDFRFLYYLLKSLNLERSATGSAQPLVTQSGLKILRCLRPPPTEQKAIAHILGTLDDKIELNRRMNETLEGIARAIFKSWFIDFDPVIDNALRAGNPIPDSMVERAEVRRRLLDQNQPSPPAPLPSGEGRKSENYRGEYDFAGLVKTARELRKKQTPVEDLFWELVRNRRFMGLKFRRQHQLGDYIADFYCHEHRLVIELDGGVHNTKQKKDHKRDAWMQAQGYTVLRFKNEQLLDDPEFVLSRIASSLPLPLPLGEGRGEGMMECGAFHHLFPDMFEDSELGEIPQRWTVGTLADLSELSPETWKPATAPEHITYVDLANTKNGVINSTQDYSFRDAPSRARRVLRCGDTIVGTVRPGNRSFAYVSCDGLTGSTGFAVLRPKSGAAREFVYLAATREDSIDHLAHLADGAAYPAVRPDVVHSLECMVPTSEALTAFHAAVAPLFAGMGSNMEISQSLDAARDHLLPSLLSGRVPIPLTQEAAP